ncbi:MFS transporter, OFA family, oxalate/formate antiporter [Pilibacter termitis]|uniref:MFS transporter, OFA family, oxalate/formate antiporter n=1 Tax=Pilibacter termitis TaxID=263852 RepID=A0A1T4KMU6_9ENTE|nr:OFA family MFS transporter [Pilibacter termitis]SJZ43726.1 MFS transporter, OFA family, oxalate/formate antiporter [Pilibacter termitis]
MENKWVRAAIPALLIHVSIGSVYCWSVYKQLIADEFNTSAATVEWGFSLAIFFLGMSAAFLGPLVEKDIKRSSLVALFCFTLGFALTGLSISTHFLLGIYLSFGVLMGIGLGVGYLTPVKNLMLWFSGNKGLATGIAVAGFGLAKVIATPAMEILIPKVGLVNMFYILACFYAGMMFLAFVLIKRPKGYVYSAKKSAVKRFDLMKRKEFLPIWFMFYLNITCGLALISQEKDFLKIVLHEKGFTEASIIGVIATVMAVDAAFNTGGRLFFSSVSDRFKFRETSYKILFSMSIFACGAYLIMHMISPYELWSIFMLLFLVNAGYGGGFSTLPVLLDQHYGMSTISTVHGLVLSAWAFAGLSGNQLSSFIVHKLHLSYNTVVMVILALYMVSFGLITYVKGLKQREV